MFGFQQTDRPPRISRTCGDCVVPRDSRTHPPGTLRTQLKYGCHEHRKSGTCENNWYIRQDRVEDQLLSAIEERVFNRIDPVVKRCEEEVWRRPMAFGGRGGNSR